MELRIGDGEWQEMEKAEDAPGVGQVHRYPLDSENVALFGRSQKVMVGDTVYTIREFLEKLGLESILEPDLRRAIRYQQNV